MESCRSVGYRINIKFVTVVISRGNLMTDDEVFDRLILTLYAWLHCLWKCTTVGVPVSLKRVKTEADERYCLFVVTPPLPRDGGTARTAIQVHAVNLIDIRLGERWQPISNQS